MGKVVISFKFTIFIILLAALSLGSQAGVVETGNPIIYRGQKRLTADIGVYIYPGDRLSMTPGTEITFESSSIYLKSLTAAELEFNALNRYKVSAGTIYFAARKNNPELLYYFNDSLFSLKATRFVLAEENDNLVIYNLTDSMRIYSPISLTLAKDHYTVFNGSSFSRPASRKIVYSGELPYPFMENIISKKSIGTTAWLSAILPGLGHLYSNNYIKGFVGLAASLALMNNLSDNENKAVYLALWSWSFVDSIAETRKYNNSLESSDEP